jgi:hypothetical protein
MATDPNAFLDPIAVTNGAMQKIPDYGTNTDGYQQAFDKIKELQNASKKYNPDVITKELANYADIFKQHFNDYAGRDPNSAEFDRFYKEVVAPQGSYPGGQYPGIPELINRADNLIQNSLSGEIQKGKQGEIDKKTKDSAGTINQLFQSTLGRDATADESTHFGKLLASDQADTYTLGQALQQLPEYQNAQNAKNRADITGQLQKADTDYFNQNLMPSIQQNFALAGRSVDPGNQTLANAFASAGNQQNVQREQYLAQLSASDYANTRQNTINNYLNASQRQQQLQDQSTARGYQTADMAYGRANDVSDYYKQQSAYQDYLNRMGRRSSSGLGSTIGAGIGTVGGAVVGAYFGGPMGAAAGASAGGAGGRAVGGMFDKY